MTVTPAKPAFVLPADRTPMLAVRGRRKDIASALSRLHIGEICWAEDEGILYVVSSNKSGGKELHQASAGVYIATTPPAIQGTTAPHPAEIGTIWYDTTAQALFIWDGQQWRGVGDDAPTIIGPTKPAKPQDRQFFLDTSNKHQPRLFLYEAAAGKWHEIVPPLASLHNDGLMSQGDYQKLKGLRNAPIPDWNAGPGVPGEILNKPTIYPPPKHATTDHYGVVILAKDEDLKDENCRDKVVVAAQVAWLWNALQWWRSTWLPGNHLSCGKEDVAVWNGMDDVLEVLGPIQVNVDGRGWSTGPEPVIHGMTVEARWDPTVIAELDDGELIVGSIVAPGEKLRVDYSLETHREMGISSVPPAIDVPMGEVVTSEPLHAEGSDVPYLIWAVSEASMAEIRIDDGDWQPIGGEPFIHGCGDAQIQVRHLTSHQVNDEQRTWVFAGTLNVNVSTAFHSITVSTIAPQLGTVRLLERQPGGDRFTGQAFDLQAALAEPGVPVAERQARFEVIGRIERRATTDLITAATGGTPGLVRVSHCLSKEVFPGAKSPYPKLYGEDAPRELEDPARARYYVPTGVPASYFTGYEANRDKIPLTEKNDRLLAKLIDLGSPMTASVVLPWARYSGDDWDRGHRSGTLRVYRWSAQNGWAKDGEILNVRCGQDYRYTLRQPSQWIVVAIAGDEDDLPHVLRIDATPETTLAFASDRDLAHFHVGDRVEQDDAALITGPVKIEKISHRNKLVNGLQRLSDLPYRDLYGSGTISAARLRDLPAVKGEECAWIRYRTSHDGPGTIGFVVRRHRGTSGTVYVKVRRGHSGGEILERHAVKVTGDASESRDAAKISRVTFVKLPSEGYITLHASNCDYVYILWLGGESSMHGPSGTVVSVDPATRQMVLRDLVGSFSTGHRVLGPRHLEEDLHHWLDVDPDGVVRGLLNAAPPWRSYPFAADLTTIRFPPVWDSGRPPDTDLPPGISLGADVRAVSDAGIDQATAAPIVPGGGTLVAGAAAMAFTAYDVERRRVQAAAMARLSALGFTTVDLAALHL